MHIGLLQYYTGIHSIAIIGNLCIFSSLVFITGKIHSRHQRVKEEIYHDQK